MEDALSSGTLLNRSRSTSTWKVGIVLNQVAGGLDGDRLAAAGNLQDQLDVGSHRGANLHVLAQRREAFGGDIDAYGLKGTLENANWPVASVVVVCSNSLTALARWTVALGTTAPDGSVTVPRTVPALPLCAGRGKRREDQGEEGENA